MADLEDLTRQKTTEETPTVEAKDEKPKKETKSGGVPKMENPPPPPEKKKKETKDNLRKGQSLVVYSDGKTKVLPTVLANILSNNGSVKIVKNG